MPLDAPLNSRQVDVLQWIREGCPDGRWSDFTFKATANALASRRLVTVSKRGGKWTAGLLSAGEYYLANDRYPRDHWSKRRRGQLVELDTPVRAPVVPARPVAARAPDSLNDMPKKPAVPNELTPTRQLLKAIFDAGGMLEIDTKDDQTSYKSLVGIINRRGMAPDGQEVIMVRGMTSRHVAFRLSSVSDWKTEAPSETMATERIGRWHPAVATLRNEKRLDGIGKELRRRAFRLLHALAREGEARGHPVRLPQRNRHGHFEDNSKLVGDLIFKVGGIECSVDIRQPKDRVEHTPTAYEVEREKKYGWPPSRYDYVPSDRLSVVIDTSARYQSKESWTDTKTLPLHVRLPDVMLIFERWAVADAERQKAEELAAVEQQQMREEAERLARLRHAENVRADVLRSQHRAWREARELREFIAALRDVAAKIDEGADRAAADEWLEWCKQYVDSAVDPLGGRIALPEIRDPTWEERSTLVDAILRRMQREKARGAPYPYS